MRAAKLRSPVRDIYLGQVSPRSRNLAYLSRSASTQASSSKYGFRGAEQSAGAGDEVKGSGKRMNMLTRGASFRRQGSSGMTWADNWIFTDDGMFLGRHTKVADDKGVATNGLHPIASQQSKNLKVSEDFPEELQRSRSVGSGSERKHRSRQKSGLWGLKWLKKNFKKAFR